MFIDSFVIAMGFLGLAFRVMNGLDAAADGAFLVLCSVGCHSDSHSGEPRQDGMGRRDAIC